MSATFKTVIQLSSVARRQRTESDPLPHDPARQRKTSSHSHSSSGSKHSTPTEHIEIGQPCLKCGQKCPGYMQHIWRKQCLHCGCPRSTHSVETEPSSVIPSLEQLTLDMQQQGPSKLRRSDIEMLAKYSWYPPGVSYGMVEKYMQSLPSECVPEVGTEGDNYRRKQCFLQIPLYDFSLDACHNMTDLEKKRYGKLTDRTREKFFGVGKLKLQNTMDKKPCTECLQQITMGSVYISSDRAGPEKQWHPQCFRCNTCHELLVDLLHCHSPDHEGLYCCRHHGELLVPRCAGCDELILSSQFTETVGKNWHKEHFCCAECDDQLVGKPNTTYQDSILCERCFNKYAPKCHRCEKPIGINQKKMSTKGKCYHEACFVCKRCKEGLMGERYFIIEDDIICGDCVQPVGQCQGCKEGITPTVSYLQHNNRCWHADCFKCNICRTWLVDGQFHEMASSLMCNACYVEKMSHRCEVCNSPIAGKAIQFSLKWYHVDCFLCCSCKEPLVWQNGKVKEKDGEPYCQRCVLHTYKKCYKCSGPITSRHTIYNNNPFHLECFQCNRCGTSVASGEFFETSLKQILCPRCAE